MCKLLLVFCSLLLVGCASSPSEGNSNPSTLSSNIVFPETIQWGSQIFRLGWSDVKDNLVLLEYVPEGQTVQMWENMITVQVTNESQLGAIKNFVEISKAYRVEEPRIMKNDQSGDIILDTVLFDDKKGTMEHDLVKFSKTKNGRLVKIFFQT